MKNTYLCQDQNSCEKVSIDVRHSNIRQPSPCDYQDRPRGRGNCTCHHAQYTTKQKMKLAAWLVMRLLLSTREAAEETEIPKTHLWLRLSFGLNRKGWWSGLFVSLIDWLIEKATNGQEGGFMSTKQVHSGSTTRQVKLDGWSPQNRSTTTWWVKTGQVKVCRHNSANWPDETPQVTKLTGLSDGTDAICDDLTKKNQLFCQIVSRGRTLEL